MAVMFQRRFQLETVIEKERGNSGAPELAGPGESVFHLLIECLFHQNLDEFETAYASRAFDIERCA